MASLEEIRNTRIEKMKVLQDKGLNPYPASTAREYSLKQVTDDFESLSQKDSVVLSGRVMAIRGQGAIVFFNVNDGTLLFKVS